MIDLEKDKRVGGFQLDKGKKLKHQEVLTFTVFFQAGGDINSTINQ